MVPLPELNWLHGSLKTGCSMWTLIGSSPCIQLVVHQLCHEAAAKLNIVWETSRQFGLYVSAAACFLVQL
jgi:hypothetical protein